MAKKEFVQLAHTYKKQNVNGWFASEKLDGMRFYWDGGMTRGMPKVNVPWANNDKDKRYIDTQYATGLWSRYGNVIHAPDWWINHLPAMPLDGEGYIPGHRQDLMSIVKKLEPGEGWEKVGYHVFDVPPFGTLFPEHKEWIASHKGNILAPAPMAFSITQQLLRSKVGLSQVVKIVDQVAITTEADIQPLLDAVVSRGGEGLILRAPWATYEARRSHNVLKVKPFDDDEGVVVGYTAGKGKYLGMIGNVILQLADGVMLEMSGFTDVERYIFNDEMSAWANLHPGFQMPITYDNDQFPKGSIITFKYRGKSKDGVPQEARYWRKHG